MLLEDLGDRARLLLGRWGGVALAAGGVTSRRDQTLAGMGLRAEGLQEPRLGLFVRDDDAYITEPLTVDAIPTRSAAPSRATDELLSDGPRSS